MQPDHPPLRAQEGHTYKSSKVYNHSVGLSCVFRQWRATHSHCRFLHGYAIKVELEFESDTLDDRNWVQDFGGLKDIKKWLEDTFDHKTIVARDDPKISIYKESEIAGLLQLTIVDHVGCESFARMIFEEVRARTEYQHANGDYRSIRRVKVSEHDGNSAEYARMIPLNERFPARRR